MTRKQLVNLKKYIYRTYGTDIILDGDILKLSLLRWRMQQKLLLPLYLFNILLEVLLAGGKVHL